jgi:hypothetical protein
MRRKRAEHAEARAQSIGLGARTPQADRLPALKSLAVLVLWRAPADLGRLAEPVLPVRDEPKSEGRQRPNVLSVRESLARDRILGAVRERLAGPEVADYIRKRVAERLGTLSREIDTELAERTARLARVEERIRGISLMQLDGDRSPPLAEMRRDFEAQAATERAAVGELRAPAAEPIRLPNLAELAERVRRLKALTSSENVEAAREALLPERRHDGLLAGSNAARAELLPLAVMFSGPGSENAPSSGARRRCPVVAARGAFGSGAAEGKVIRSRNGESPQRGLIAVVARGGFEPPTFGL